MSQEKAQLIAPIGIMTVSGMTATGVITATSFTGNVVGSAKSLVNGTDVTAGVVTGTSFVGNLTGNIQRLADSAPDISAGVTTASSFVGNLTGSVTDLTSQPAITVGLVTATSLSGPITGNVTGDVVGDVTGNVTGTIAGNVTGNVTGNATGTSGGLGVNYNGGWTGAGTSQVRVGVITATYFHGDGSNLEGVSSGPVSQQSVGITSAATTIDLSNGNLIFATQSASTTVSFANTSNGNVYFVRTKDDNTTARTITWPDGFNWDGGTEPTLLDNPRTTDAQVFLLVTRNMGVTWYGKQVVNVDPQTFTMFVWGRGSNGQLGQNNGEANYSSPIQLGGDGIWGKLSQSSLDTDGGYMAQTKTDGTLWVWGYNSKGQLGLNQPSSTRISSPTQLSGTTWSQAATIQDAGCMATKSDGTLWVWGDNIYGQLGLIQGTNAEFSSPVQLPGTTWGTDSKMGAGYYRAGNIKTDGTMWMWGYNDEGQLGLNDRSLRSSPAQIPGTWSQFSRSLGHGTNLAIKTNGTLWSWGSAFAGNLGIGAPDNGKRSSPCAVGSDTNWTKASAGYKHSAAIKDDGSLWMFGSNEFGQLGFNQSGFPNSYSSPKQLPGTWNSIFCAREWNIATKTDGTLWVWGQNDEAGYFGRNVAAEGDISSPVQIPGTDWNDAVANYYAAMANKIGG